MILSQQFSRCEVNTLSILLRKLIVAVYFFHSFTETFERSFEATADDSDSVACTVKGHTIVSTAHWMHTAVRSSVPDSCTTAEDCAERYLRLAVNLRIAINPCVIANSRIAVNLRIAVNYRLAEHPRIAKNLRLAENTRIAVNLYSVNNPRLAENLRVAEDLRIVKNFRIAVNLRVAENLRIVSHPRITKNFRIVGNLRIAGNPRIAVVGKIRLFFDKTAQLACLHVAADINEGFDPVKGLIAGSLDFLVCQFILFHDLSFL